MGGVGCGYGKGGHLTGNGFVWIKWIEMDRAVENMGQGGLWDALSISEAHIGDFMINVNFVF